MIGLVAGLVEDHHHLIADELVHLASEPLHQRDDAAEVRVQHVRHFRGRMPLGEGREARQVGEEDAHVLRAGQRLVEIEGAETLFVPLAAGGKSDHDERDQHEHMPFPPGDMPVASPGDHDHCLGEQGKGECDREDERRPPPAIEAEIAERCGPEERHADGGEGHLPAVELLPGERLVEWPRLGEGDRSPEREQAEKGDDECRRAPHHRRRSRPAQLERRGGGKQPRDHEADRRRQFEAGVLTQENVRRRQRVKREKAEAGHEGERDQEQPGVAAPTGRDAERIAEPERDQRGRQDEPEVGSVALPADVGGRCGAQERDQDERS